MVHDVDKGRGLVVDAVGGGGGAWNINEQKHFRLHIFK